MKRVNELLKNFDLAAGVSPLRENKVQEEGPGGTGLLAKHIVVLFLKGFFNQRKDDYEFKYHQDPKKSKVNIRDVWAIDADENSNFRPHICVISDGQAVGSRFIGGNWIYILKHLEMGTTLHNGSFTIKCLGRNGSMEAERLSDVVYNLILRYADVLEAMGFHSVGNPSKGQERIASFRDEKRTEIKGLEIDVRFDYQIQSMFSKVDKKLVLAGITYDLGLVNKDEYDSWLLWYQEAEGKNINACPPKEVQ